MPMIGAVTGIIVDVTPVSIHGDVYYDVLLHPDGAPPDASRRVRVASHACAQLPHAQPMAGQRVTVQMLMGQVTAMSLAR